MTEGSRTSSMELVFGAKLHVGCRITGIPRQNQYTYVINRLSCFIFLQKKCQMRLLFGYGATLSEYSILSSWFRINWDTHHGNRINCLANWGGIGVYTAVTCWGGRGQISVSGGFDVNVRKRWRDLTQRYVLVDHVVDVVECRRREDGVVLIHEYLQIRRSNFKQEELYKR